MAFEIENEIKRKAASLEVSLNFLSALSGVSSTKLSTAFNNARRLNREDAKTLQTVIRELEALVEACRPIPIRFANPAAIRELLEAKRDGDLFVAVGLNRAEEETTNGDAVLAVLAGGSDAKADASTHA
jgi:hypothetical protein